MHPRTTNISTQAGTGVRNQGGMGDSVSTEKPNIHTRLISEQKSLANKEESIYKVVAVGDLR